MPNWENASDYAFTSNLDDARWIWAFLRRNKKYQDDFAVAEKTRGTNLATSTYLKIGVPSEPTNLLIWWSLGANWWIDGPIRDPLCDDPPLFFRGFPWQPNSKQIERFYHIAGDALTTEDDASPHDIPEQQRPEFATLVFDLRKPLSNQITRAGKLLEARQTMVPKESKKNPPHKGSKNWPIYIRLLDAHEAGVTCHQIAKTLLKSAFDNKQAYDPVKKIERQLARAKELRAAPMSILDWSPPIQLG